MFMITFNCSMIHSFLIRKRHTYLRASLGPQFLSPHNSLFNIWPGSILQLQECEYSKLK